MQPVYEVHKLSKYYGRIRALDHLDLALAPGKLVGLLGPNGSGKTTLIKIGAGLLTPDQGSVLIGGMAPGPATKAIVSYLPDRMALPTEMTTKDVVSMYSDFFADFDRVKAQEMLRDLHLSDSQRIGSMSKGTQEKVQLCLVMSRAAKLYLLDEPLGGVDPAAREYILSTILRNYSEDSAVLFSTHLISDIEKVLDEVAILRQGKLLLHDSVDHLRQEKGMSVDEFFKEVFRC
ncbi:ABC transporter ATP-binding protein [uncultured Gemmiger sp.]|uniref:ABC transporter ATP-binding protein n=1 Tax=uncultured Gemmiger sp. TaxID=1623490 RepID=UPI0025E0A466|nr:ABC transporter ATP-binding protein [uncultured Gemmiger sp.]